MKTLTKVTAGVLIAALLAGLVSYSGSLTQNRIHLVDKKEDNGAPPLRFHFALIAEDMGSSFWQSVKAGAQRAAKTYQAAVEFDGPMVQDEDEELKCLNIAIAANVDGIAVYVPDKTKFRPLINKAVGKGISVVTIESDDAGSSRKAYIGPDSYDIGIAQGALVREAANGQSDVALILGGNFALNSDLSESLLKGFQDGIRLDSEIRVQSVQNSSSGYFKAEEIIRNILYKYPSVNTVVCTSESDTSEIVQVLIDLNRIKSMTVIGYSNSAKIRDYIRNSVIFGSAYENPEETGSRCIGCLTDLRGKTNVPSVIKTSVYSITKNNLVNYPGGS